MDASTINEIQSAAGQFQNVIDQDARSLLAQQRPEVQPAVEAPSAQMQPHVPPFRPRPTLTLKNQEEDSKGPSTPHKAGASTSADAPTTNMNNPAAGPTEAMKRVRSILDGGIHSTYDAIID